MYLETIIRHRILKALQISLTRLPILEKNRKINIKMCGMLLKQCLEGNLHLYVIILEDKKSSKIYYLRFHLNK